MRLPIVFILPTIVIDAMGIGLILPVMPDLIREVEGGDLGTGRGLGRGARDRLRGDAVPVRPDASAACRTASAAARCCWSRSP